MLGALSSYVGGMLGPMTPEQLLDFEATHTRHDGAKEDSIRALGLTPARYYVLLQRAAESVEGIKHDPITARRVRERAR